MLNYCRVNFRRVIVGGSDGLEILLIHYVREHKEINYKNY